MLTRMVGAVLLAGACGTLLAAGEGGKDKDYAAYVGQPAVAPAPPSRPVSQAPAQDWPLPNGDYASTRFTSLDQINVRNVASLKPVARYHTGVRKGHEGGPLKVGNTLYVVTPFPNKLMAIALDQPGGPVRWTYTPDVMHAAYAKACCGPVNRGASYGDGKVVFNTLDGTTVAVDAQTGREVWRVKLTNIEQGETLTMAPLVVKDEVIVGNSGDDYGARGWIKALDLDTGAVRWTAWHSGPDSDVRIDGRFKPFYRGDQGEELGLKTWPPDQWRYGGGTADGWVSYDPETNLIFYGSGHPSPINAVARPGDNKWTSTIFARDADTGEAVWAWQATPHDAWGYGEAAENVLVDMPWRGHIRKLLLHPGRNGFMFVLDRVTGELLSANPYVAGVNWATRYDAQTAAPVVDLRKYPQVDEVTRDICPSASGAKGIAPSAFSPLTGLLYIPAHNLCMDLHPIAANYIAGTPYLGALIKSRKGKGGFLGELVAWNPVRGTRQWAVREKYPVEGGVLATAGGLVFYGTLDGWFKALDARSGAELWKVKLPSGIVADPMSFVGGDGRQYIAVYAGVGGRLGRVAFPEIDPSDPYAMLGAAGALKDLKRDTAPGDLVYVFGL